MFRHFLLGLFGLIPAEKLWEIEQKTVDIRKENDQLRTEIQRVSRELTRPHYQVKRVKRNLRIRVYFWTDPTGFYSAEEISRWVGKTAVKAVSREVIK